MALVDHSHFDATSQLLEFAEQGRLVSPRPSSSRSAMSPVPVVVVTSAVIGLGAGVLAAGLHAASLAVAAMGTGAVFAGLAMLIPALNALSHDTDADHIVDIRAAAVVPPRQVRPGNWIERDGAWVRVDEAGPDRAGGVTALLSTGDVIELSRPVTVAGGPFQPLDH